MTHEKFRQDVYGNDTRGLGTWKRLKYKIYRATLRRGDVYIRSLRGVGPVPVTCGVGLILGLTTLTTKRNTVEDA